MYKVHTKAEWLLLSHNSAGSTFKFQLILSHIMFIDIDRLQIWHPTFIWRIDGYDIIRGYFN